MTWKIKRPAYVFGATALVAVAALVWSIGQPDPVRKWRLMEGRYSGLLTSREVFIHPLEYVKTYNESTIKLITLDLRPEAEFQAFHLTGAENVTLNDLLDSKVVAPLAQLPSQGVVILIADNDSVSVRAWEYLKVQGVSNLYILENGLQNWKDLFADKSVEGKPLNLSAVPLEVLQLFPKDSYVPKIKIASKKRAGGLCS